MFPMQKCKQISLFSVVRDSNPFWDSKPELFSDNACLRIPYQPCIVLFGKFFSGTPVSNWGELRLHLNVVSTGSGVFKSRHILLHKYDARYSSSFPAAADEYTHSTQSPLEGPKYVQKNKKNTKKRRTSY